MTSDDSVDGDSDTDGGDNRREQPSEGPDENSPPEGKQDQESESGAAEDEEESAGRRLALIGLAAALAVCLAGFSGALAAQTTVLSADYVGDAMEREGGYAEMETTFEEAVIEEAQASTANTTVFESDRNVLAEAIRDTITLPYVERETRGNVREVYDYLHGRTSALDLTADAGPITGNISGAVAAEIRDIPLGEFVRQPAVGESLGDMGIDREELGETIESREAFAETQAEVSQQVEASGRDADDLNQSLREGTDLGNVSRGVERAVYDLQGTVVVAMTSEMSHDEYVSRMESRRGAFAEAVGEFTRQRFRAEMGSSVALPEGVAPTESGLRDSRETVSTADTLLVALPLVALAALVAILWVTRSVTRSSRLLGAALVAAGILGALARFLGDDTIRAAVRDAMATGSEGVVAEAVLASVEGMLGQLAVQSAALVALGVAFLGFQYAVLRYEPGAIPAAWR